MKLDVIHVARQHIVLTIYYIYPMFVDEIKFVNIYSIGRNRDKESTDDDYIKKFKIKKEKKVYSDIFKNILNFS